MRFSYKRNIYPVWKQAVLLHAAALLIFVSALPVQTSAQDKAQKVFEAIPENLRPRLIERLRLYVEYERTQHYNKLYDLVLESVETPRTLDRDAYVVASWNGIAKGYRRILLKFKPNATINISLDDQSLNRFELWGVAKVKDESDLYEMDAAIEARWINGDWYFSGVGSVIID